MSEKNEAREEFAKETYVYGMICQAANVVLSLREQLESALYCDDSQKEEDRELLGILGVEKSDEQMDEMYQAIQSFLSLIDYYGKQYDEKKEMETAIQLRDVL